MEYLDIEKYTRKLAKKIAGVEDLTIKFSNSMKKCHAICYWAESPQEIYFNKKFIYLNKESDDFDTILKELVVHECVHLKDGYDTHDKKFEDCCRSYGVEPYGYSVNVIDLKPLYKTYCKFCNLTKSFYSKPRNLICKRCGTPIDVRDFRNV